MKPALLVIDVQNAFLPYMAEEHRKIAPLIINMAIDLFRSHGLPVYSIYHTDPIRGPSPDSEGFAYDHAIKITSDDILIVKNFPNSFKNTPLEGLLRESGCDSIFLCGLSSTGCVLATYYGAKDLGFKTMLIKDALLGPRVEYTDCIEDFCDSVNVNVLQSILEGLNQAA
ncbi:MAG: cysteine hydrolase family protein [Terracidiphilus sp.]